VVSFTPHYRMYVNLMMPCIPHLLRRANRMIMNTEWEGCSGLWLF